MKRFAILLLLVVVGGGGCAARGAHYALGYGVANGAALLPPTATRGTTAMISYHEEGGVVARSIILGLMAMGLKDPNGDTTVTSKTETERVGDTIYERTTTTTTFTPTTPEERAEREEAIADFEAAAPGIMHDSPMPVSLDFGVARRGFGGDTRATTFDMMYQHSLAEETGIGVGFGIRSYTFYDRSVARVGATGTTVTATRSMGPLDYVFIGFPMRFTQLVAPRTAVFVQYDFNLRRFTDNDGSPLTLGVDFRLPIVRFKGTVTTDRFDAHGLTFGLEGIVGF